MVKLAYDLLVKSGSTTPRCMCGYDRGGLAAEAICPECGKLEIMPDSFWARPILFSFTEAWHNDSGNLSKTAFVMSVLSVTATIAVLVQLINVVFSDNPTGGPIVFPPQIWFVALPLYGATLILTLTSICMKGWALGKFTLWLAVLSVPQGLIIFFVYLLLTHL